MILGLTEKNNMAEFHKLNEDDFDAIKDVSRTPCEDCHLFPTCATTHKELTSKLNNKYGKCDSHHYKLKPERRG